jgi:CheY-like chemotaxis protein
MPLLALVVDDSMLMRYTVCRFLEQRGYAVETASNGAEALEVLGRVQPALIVTDMVMPKMSGSELISALKSKPETAGVPIIIVAYKAGGFDETEKRANFAIYKDIDIEAQLAKALDALADNAGKQQSAGK